nr:uncharacterized protein LOC113802509 [Penaeus vannamei]
MTFLHNSRAAVPHFKIFLERFFTLTFILLRALEASGPSHKHPDAIGDAPTAKADKPSTWTRPAAKTPHENPKLNTAGTWTPDPSQLLGEYEEPPPPRDTNAYFMTDNNTVVTVQVGMTADLRCQVFDVAEHETDWTLHVRYAQPRDAGVYECQLSAHPPIGVYTTLNVIEAKAEIEGESEIYVQTGSSVQLTCKLKDFTEPPTYVFWFHAEHMVNYDSNKRRRISSLNLPQHSRVQRDGVSELRISKVTKHDSGNYTCQPANARPASVSLHVITEKFDYSGSGGSGSHLGTCSQIRETPAAMQRASATEIQYRVSLALISTLVALIAFQHLMESSGVAFEENGKPYLPWLDGTVRRVWLALDVKTFHAQICQRWHVFSVLLSDVFIKIR